MLKHLNRHFKFVSLLMALMAPSIGHTETLDSANTAWLITATALVLFMTIPGLSAGGFDSSPGTSRVPRQTEISIGVTPVYSRNELRQFGLDTLASGAGSSKGFI